MIPYVATQSTGGPHYGFYYNTAVLVSITHENFDELGQASELINRFGDVRRPHGANVDPSAGIVMRSAQQCNGLVGGEELIGDGPALEQSHDT